MYQDKTVTAILLAAGSGTRFGAGENKVYVEVGGKPILQYSLEVLTAHPYVDRCLLVVKAGEETAGEELVGRLRQVCADGTCSATAAEKPVIFVHGGFTRQESVYNALQETDSDLVIIQDAARPMIRPEYVTCCVETMDRVPGAAIGVKSKDTIKLTDDAGLVRQTTVRANTWVVQTPQCFRTEVLKAAHETFREAPGITDDCSILELAGEPVQMLPGDYTNIKVTTPEDRELAEAFLLS